MGLIDSHIIQLEAAVAVLHRDHGHAAHDKAQRDFAKQLGVGLASRLQAAAFGPHDIYRVLAAVDSTLAGDDLLDQYTKAVQVLSISAAETAVKDALEALQLSRDAISLSEWSSGQQLEPVSRSQDGRHNPSATDTQQQGLDLCTQLSKQLQGQMVHYKETGKQLTAIGEQLGKASEGLTCLNEQLQAAPASSQAEILSKASQDLDEVLMSLAGLQLAYEGSTPYTHNTNKTLKALRGLQKQYATASQGGSSQGAGGSLNYVIEAQQAWNSAAAALQKDTSDISAATVNLSSCHNSLAALLRDLDLDADDTSSAEAVKLIRYGDAQLQQLDLQQQQQLAACGSVREQLFQLFDLVRNNSSSSSGGSAVRAGTSPPPAGHTAIADGRLSSSSCSSSHATAQDVGSAGTGRVAGPAHSSNLGDLDSARSVNSSSSYTSGSGHHVPAPAAAAVLPSSSSPNRRCSRLGLASKAAAGHSKYEAAQADPGDAVGAGVLVAAAAAAVAQQPTTGHDGPMQWHENALSQVEDDAQTSDVRVQQEAEQQPQEPQQQQDLQSPALQQLRELQCSLAAAVTAGQPLAGDELLQMCEDLQQLVQQAQQDSQTVQHQVALPAVQLTARLTSCEPGLDYNTVGSQLVDTSSMLKWGNPVFRRDSYPGLTDAGVMTPDSSTGGAYNKLRRMSEAHIEGVFIASVAAATDADVSQACAASPRGSQGQSLSQQRRGLDIAVHDHCSTDVEESTTPRTYSDMPEPPSRLECLDKPPSSRDMDAAAATAAVDMDSLNPEQDSGADAAGRQQAAGGQVDSDLDTSASVAVDELIAATQEVSNRLGPRGLADLADSAAAVEGLSDVAILMNLISHLVQHQQGVAALAAKLHLQQPHQGSNGPATTAKKLAVGTSADSTPTSAVAAAAWTIPALYGAQQLPGQVGPLSSGDSMLEPQGRASCSSEEQSIAAAAAEDSSSHGSRQLTRSSTLGLPISMEGSAVALGDEDSSSLLHTNSNDCCGAAVLAVEGQSNTHAVVQQQQELAAGAASRPLGDRSCLNSSSTEVGQQSSETLPARCCSDSSILGGATSRSLNCSDSYLSSLNKMLQAESRQLQQQVGLLQQQLAKAQSEAASLREKLQQQQHQRQQQEQQIADQQQKVSELLEQLEAAHAAAAAANGQHAAELQQRLSSAAVETDGMQQQQLQLIEQLQQHFAAAQQEIANLTEQQHDRKQEVEGLLLQHQQQLQGLQQQLGETNEQIASLTGQQASVSALQHENQQLQQKNAVLQHQLSTTRSASELLHEAEEKPDTSAAGSNKVGELSEPVICSSPVKKGRFPLFRRATTDAVTASCPSLALGPAASQSISLQGTAKDPAQGNNDNSSSLRGSLEGSLMQGLPPTSGSATQSAPKRRTTWDVNPSSAAAAAAATSAQKALRAFLGAIKGAGTGKKHLIGRVMVDGTVSIQSEDSEVVVGPVSSFEPSTAAVSAPIVGLVEHKDGPEKEQHLQQQRWRQQQLQMQRLLAEQPSDISDAEAWDVQHSAWSITGQHRSVSEIGVQLEDFDHSAAAAAEANTAAADNIGRTEAMGASVPALIGSAGAATSDSTKWEVAAHMVEQQSHLEAPGKASVQQLLENAASLGPGWPTQQQQVSEGSAVSTVQHVEQLAQDLRAKQLKVEELEREVFSKASQLTTMQQELQRFTDDKLQLTAKLEAAESQLAALTGSVAAAETGAKAAAAAESAMAVNVLTQANELSSAEVQLAEQSEKVQQLLLKLKHAEITVAAACCHLAVICRTVAVAEGAARAAAAAAAAGELPQQAHDLQAAQQQLQQQLVRMQELVSQLESAGGSAAAADANLEAVHDSVDADAARVVIQPRQQQQAVAPEGGILSCEDGNSSQRHALSAVDEVAADNDSSQGPSISSSVPCNQLQAALPYAHQQAAHQVQQLFDFKAWVELLRLGLARIKQALDSNEEHTDCNDSPQHTPSPQSTEMIAVGSSSITNSSLQDCRLAAVELEAVTEVKPDAAAAAAAVASWSETTAEQLVLLHEVQSIADEVQVICAERHLLQSALQEQLRAISRLEQSLQAAKEQQQLQGAALLQLEEEHIAAANAAAERAIEQQEQEQVAAAATAAEQLSIIQKAMLKHEEEQQAAAAEKICQLQQQEQEYRAAAAEGQQALALLKQQQQAQELKWHICEQEYQAAAEAAAQMLLEVQQQQRDAQAAAAEAMQKLAEVVDQQQHKEAEWQQREQQHLATAKAAAEYDATAAAAAAQVAELQAQLQLAQQAGQSLKEKVDDLRAQLDTTREAAQQQREAAAAAAAQAAELQLAKRAELEQRQANATIAELQSQLEVTRLALHEQQAAAAKVAELQNQLQSAQETLQQQQAAAAASAAELANLQKQAAEEQRAAVAKAESTIADLQSRLHAAQVGEQQQQTAAAEAAATITRLQEDLKLAQAAVQEQQTAAADAETTIADLRHQLQEAQTAAATQSVRQLAELQEQLQLAQAAEQQQQAAAVEAVSIIADLRRQLEAAEQQQVTIAAETAATISQLESRLELVSRAEEEQQAAAAQAGAAIASLEEQLHAALAAAQGVPALEQQLRTLHANLAAAEAKTKEERTAVADAAASPSVLAELQSQLPASQAAKQEQQTAAAESAAQVADLLCQMQAAQTAAQQVPQLKQEIIALHAQLEAAYAETKEVAAKAFTSLQQVSTAAAAADASKALAEQATAAQVAAEAAAQEARHDLAQLQQQYMEISSQKAEVTFKLAALQQQRQNADQQVSKLQQQLHELTSLHDGLMQQLQRVDQSTAGPLDAASSLDSAAVGAESEVQSGRQPQMSKVDQVRYITEQVQQLLSARSRAQEITAQLAAAEQALQQQKSISFAAHARAADLQHRLAAAELSGESLAATQRAEQARQQQAGAAAAAAAAAEVQGLRQQISDRRSELAAAGQARQQQLHSAAAAEADAQSLRKQISALNAEIQQLRSESEQLRPQQQQEAAAAAAAVEANGAKQLSALQSECDGLRQQMQAMQESCANRDREIEAQQQQLVQLQAELADVTELNQQLEAAAAAATAATATSQAATIGATAQTADTTNCSSNAGRVDQRTLTSWGSMTLRHSLRGSRAGASRASRDGGLRTSRDGSQQQQQDAFMLMRDLSDREHELADLKAVLQERDTTLAETNQELMLVQQSMAELQVELAELQAELQIVRTEAAVKVAAANNKALVSQQAARQSQEVASAAALHSSKTDSSMVQQLQHELKMVQGLLAVEQEDRLREATAFATALKQAGADTADAEVDASAEIMRLQAELGQNMRLVQQQADQLQQQAERLQQQQQYEEQLQSSRDEIQQLQQQLAEKVQQLQQQQGVLKQLRQTVAQLQQQLHMLQGQILERQQQQQVAIGKHRSSDYGGMLCAEFEDHNNEGLSTEVFSRRVSTAGELMLHNPQHQQGAELPSSAQESQQLRLQLVVKQHTISRLQKRLAEVTAGQTSPLSPAQITQIGSQPPPNLGQASTSDRTRSRSDRTRSGSQTADSAAVASLRRHAAMLEGVLLEVQAESAAKDEVMQELSHQAELRVGAGYARTEELRRLYRDMASKDAYISRLEARVRANTPRTPSPTQPPQHEQQQRPTAHKPQQRQQQQQRVAVKDRSQSVGLATESNTVPKRSYGQLQTQLHAAMDDQQQHRAAAGRTGNSSSTAAAAAASLKQRAAARLRGNGQAAAVAPEPSSEGGVQPTMGRKADSTEAVAAAAGVAGLVRSAGSSKRNSTSGSLSAGQRLAAAAAVQSNVSGQAAGVAAVGAASAMCKVPPRLQQQGAVNSSSNEADSHRSLTGASWQQQQQSVVVGTSISSSSRAKSNPAGNVLSVMSRRDSISNPASSRMTPQLTNLESISAGNRTYTLDSQLKQMWVSNTLYSPRTTAESAQTRQNDNSSSGFRAGDGGTAVMGSAMQQLQHLRLQRQSQQLEGVRRSNQGYTLQQQQQHSGEWE